jgi:hypothetical protein
MAIIRLSPSEALSSLAICRENETFTQVLGEQDILLTIFHISEGHVLIWRKGKEILALGEQVINKNDPRLKLESEKDGKNGNTLVISLAEPEDEGEYTCQISSNKPTELMHNIRVRGRHYKTR